MGESLTIADEESREVPEICSWSFREIRILLAKILPHLILRGLVKIEDLSGEDLGVTLHFSHEPYCTPCAPPGLSTQQCADLESIRWRAALGLGLASVRVECQ